MTALSRYLSNESELSAPGMSADLLQMYAHGFGVAAGMMTAAPTARHAQSVRNHVLGLDPRKRNRVVAVIPRNAKRRRTRPPSPVFAAVTGPPVPAVRAGTELNNQRFWKGPRVRHCERRYYPRSFDRRSEGTWLHHYRVMTTSRYSLGTTMQRSPERLNCATRLMRSSSSADCSGGASAANVLSTGP
jgi:hypothetical protein